MLGGVVVVKFEMCKAICASSVAFGAGRWRSQSARSSWQEFLASSLRFVRVQAPNQVRSTPAVGIMDISSKAFDIMDVPGYYIPVLTRQSALFRGRAAGLHDRFSG